MSEGLPGTPPTPSEKPKKLTSKERLFIDEYLRCWNGTQAAISAGYSRKTAATIASENLRKPHISNEIERRLTESAMSADEVLGRLGRQARGSHEPWIKITDGGFIYFDFSNPEAREHLDLIKKIKTKRTRRIEGRGDNAEEWEDEWVEVELYDSQRALELLGKHHRLFTDQVDLTSGGGPVRFVVEYADKKENDDGLHDTATPPASETT